MTHFLLLLLTGQAAPAVSAASCPPEHAAMGHCTPPGGEAAEPMPAEAGKDGGTAQSPSCPPEHAAMGHCRPASPGPEGGGDVAAAEIAVAPPPAEALAGPEHAADMVWSADRMAASRDLLRREHGDIRVSKVMLDRLEFAGHAGEDGYVWDAQAWSGGDIDRLWLKSEGEGSWGRRPERAELQALWSHAIGPWFDLQAGLRHDFEPGPQRSYLVLGVQGLAPYWLELEAAAYLSDKGELSARAEIEHDLRLTQRLILQPRLAFDLQLQDVPERRIGAGLERGEAGLRLRYEIAPQFAPYVGFGLDRAFGETARLRRSAGEGDGGWSLLLGIRAWF